MTTKKPGAADCSWSLHSANSCQTAASKRKCVQVEAHNNVIRDIAHTAHLVWPAAGARNCLSFIIFSIKIFYKCTGLYEGDIYKMIINICFLLSCFKQQNVKIRLAKAFKVRFY